MDVALVLTHGCNLACDYCYAGERREKKISSEIIEQGTRLLFADGAQSACLSFFGGEPFVAFDAMRWAVKRARQAAVAEDRQLTLQCTTNGTLLGAEQVAFIAENKMRVAVSIDGVREAHEEHRRRAGGQSSFDDTLQGLRALIAAGARPDAMMVITPETVSYVFRSVVWLWDEGVHRVLANLNLRASWSKADREELARELRAVGRELLSRRIRGELLSFKPFEVGMRAQHAPAGCSAGHEGGQRKQVVVGTSGNLYPCAPMVGEDRDDGPEAALRLGRVSDRVDAILARVSQKGAGCSDGGGCACAAYLETGDRQSGGPVGLWFAHVCNRVGRAVASGLDCHHVRLALDDQEDEPLPRRPRRWAPLWVGAAAGGLLGAGWLAWQALAASSTTLGDLAGPVDEPRVSAPETRQVTLGFLAMPEIHAPPKGELARPAKIKPPRKPASKEGRTAGALAGPPDWDD